MQMMKWCNTLSSSMPSNRSPMYMWVIILQTNPSSSYDNFRLVRTRWWDHYQLNLCPTMTNIGVEAKYTKTYTEWNLLT